MLTCRFSRDDWTISNLSKAEGLTVGITLLLSSSTSAADGEQVILLLLALSLLVKSLGAGLCGG